LRRGQNAHVDAGLSKVLTGPFQQTIALAVREGLYTTLLAPRNIRRSGGRMFVRAKIKRLLAGRVNA
jgi:hypothetical protein